MSAQSRPLTVAQAEKFRIAMASLEKRRVADALSIARQLVHEAPGAADAIHLLATVLADAGDEEAAEAAFRRALSMAPQSVAIGTNYANWLVRLGREREALAVLSTLPDKIAVLIRRGRLATRLHDYANARECLDRALVLDPASASAWHALGEALRMSGDSNAAEEALREAVRLSPGRVSSLAALGNVLRSRGKIEEALLLLREAERRSDPNPRLMDAISGALQDAGEPAAALRKARELVRRFPGEVSGHASLCHLLWEHGAELAPGEDPFSAFFAAALAQPSNRDLRLRLAAMLISAKRAEQAYELLEPIRTSSVGEDAVVSWFMADACDQLARHRDAERLYAVAARSLSTTSPAFLNAYARHAFRTGQLDLARRCATGAIEISPSDQEAWAHLGTCWRLADDPREDWLFAYDRLIGEIAIEDIPGVESVAAFLPALDEVLARLHRASREPVNQSVRQGSQTAGRLFGRGEPILVALESAMRIAVDAWVSNLPRDAKHPFLSRNGGSTRFVGSWSVRLRRSGRHVNHIHSEGWISSAFYVSLPPSVRNPLGGRQGWIQFGQPLEDLGLKLPPRRTVQPAPGKLVLFPSYMWHGTLPFEDAQPRTTVAFDAQPA